MKTLLLCAAGAALVLAGAARAASPVAAALADPQRPAADTAKDASRKAAQTLAFTGVKPGDKVLELVPGGGYFTRLFADVVGPSGRVYAVTPEELAKVHPTTGIETLAANHPNIIASTQSANAPIAPEPVDLVFTAQNYHDYHDPFMGPADMAAFNKAVFAALKPGGVYVVIDHAAPAGSGLADTNTLHRIDPAAVKREVEAAGFKLADEGRFLANPADTRTVKVFDPSIRGHTDQFALKFVKPN